MLPRNSLLLLLLMLFAAAPAAAISPVSIGTSTTPDVSSNSGSVDRATETNMRPTERIEATDANACRRQHRGFMSRNTMRPSHRREALASCEGLEPAAVANQAP